MTDAFTTALVAELARKTGVCWLRYDDAPDAPTVPGPGSSGAPVPRERAAWHVWYDDALHVVCGGTEQDLPGLAEADRVEVVLRSKENGGRLVTWVGRPRVVDRDDEHWDDVVDALISDRLNLDDLSLARERWAVASTVVRIDPTGETRERPGELSDDSHAAPPPPSRATTRGPLPRVLHRRRSRSPRLS